MPMKIKDVKVATSLIIQGYLRANTDEGHPESHDLSNCLGAIEQECRDWAENLEDGAGGKTITDLINAANALAKEIDGQERRPYTQLAMFHGICVDLRSRGVDVENRVSCPAQWA